MIDRARESRNPKKVIRVTLMESYGEIGRVPVNLWYIWIAERNYGTFGQCFQVRKHTIMYRHSFWIRFLPHNADYVVLTGNIARIQFCPQYTAACLCMEQVVRSVAVHSTGPPS